MKIALVHDDFCQLGGAERLFAAVAQIFPKAPIYTSLVNWKKLPEGIEASRIKTSFMQKIPFSTKFYKLLLPLYPLAFESFDFSKYDLVISSTTRFSKSVVTNPTTVHVCYINSVPRFLWRKEVLQNYLPSLFLFFLSPLISWLKKWDVVASSRVDFFVANSKNVQRSIERIYGRESSVIHPFVDTDFFSPTKIFNWHLKSQSYYLIVSRLEKWKKIEIAIEALRGSDNKLFIVGSGSYEKSLRNIAGPNVDFLGNVSMEKLRDLYRNSLGLLVTQEEDFGISALEAQACGVPVIAFGAGGQKETVIENETGLFFGQQDQNSLKDAIWRASKVKWNAKACRRNALKFGKEQFLSRFQQEVIQHAAKQ